MTLPPDSIERRYQDDAVFHALVDMCEAWLHRAQFTPTELREAVLLAAIHYEARNPRAVTVRLERDVDEIALAYERVKGRERS